MAESRSDPTPSAAASSPIFTRSFVLTCLASLGAFLSFYLLMASLPVYVGQVGGAESVVGFIIGLFSVSAVVVRPFAGQQSDRLGRKTLLVVSSALLLASSLLYILTTSVATLSLLRLLHGFAWGIFSTTNSALVADLVPSARRGEALGYFGMFGNAAMAVGPALGAVVSTSLGFPVLFAGCGAAALIAFGASIALPAPTNDRRTSAKRAALINRRALYPSLVLAISALTYGSVVSFLPLFAMKRDLGNPGLFFTVYAVALVLARAPLGQLSDRLGRRAIIAPGLVVGAAALALLSTVNSLPALLVVAVLYGLFFAAVQPALMAMAVDRVAPTERGSAMGTFTMAMDVGIGAGAFIWGFVVQGAGYPTMYLAAAAVSLVALVVLLLGPLDERRRRQPMA